MSVTVKVKLYQDKIKAIEDAHTKAIEMTMESILSDIKTSQVVPKDTGALEDSSFVDTTGINWGYSRIIFDTPYARRMYWHPEYNFRKDKNPNAQGKWMEDYITGSKKDVPQNNYCVFLKQQSGGIVK